MAATEKIVKDFVYEGLGFPVVLESVVLFKIRGEWLPKIDVEAVSEAIFKFLPSKPAKLTGNEIKFIRTYLRKSKPAFAEIFRLSHTAVTKWETAGNSAAPISASQEIVLRLYLEDYLNVSDRQFYKSVENSVYIEDEAPLKLAL